MRLIFVLKLQTLEVHYSLRRTKHVQLHSSMAPSPKDWHWPSHLASHFTARDKVRHPKAITCYHNFSYYLINEPFWKRQCVSPHQCSSMYTVNATKNSMRTLNMGSYPQRNSFPSRKGLDSWEILPTALDPHEHAVAQPWTWNFPQVPAVISNPCRSN